jgi:hypothetical protein
MPKELMWYGFAVQSPLALLLLLKGYYVRIITMLRTTYWANARGLLVAFARYSPPSGTEYDPRRGPLSKRGKDEYIMWIDLLGTGLWSAVGFSRREMDRTSVAWGSFVIGLEEIVRGGYPLGYSEADKMDGKD